MELCGRDRPEPPAASISKYRGDCLGLDNQSMWLTTLEIFFSYFFSLASTAGKHFAAFKRIVLRRLSDMANSRSFFLPLRTKYDRCVDSAAWSKKARLVKHSCRNAAWKKVLSIRCGLESSELLNIGFEPASGLLIPGEGNRTSDFKGRFWDCASDLIAFPRVQTSPHDN